MAKNKNKKNKPKNKPEHKKVKKSFHILHCSMLFTLGTDAKRHDVTYALSQGADVVTFTEAHEQDARDLINSVGRDLDYHPVTFGGKGDNALAVKLKGDGDARFRSSGGVQGTPGLPGPTGEHPFLFTPKYVRWARLTWYDQDIWMHTAHWVFTPHVQASHGEVARLHTEITRVMCAQVKKHGQGDAISFFSGDINLDEGVDNETNHPNMPNFIFRAQGLLTIWDELHVNPPTIGSSTFDIIGSYRPDQQVEGTRYVVHPKQHSDHRPISAYYDIDVSKKVVTGGGGSSSDDDDPVDSDDDATNNTDFYATGGNIDWSDYLDNEIYQLPFATGDSQYGG